MTDAVRVVVPCFNEADRLERAEFEAFLDTSGAPGLLFVDDGSTDGTADLLHGIAGSRRDRAQVLSLPGNRGKAEAVRAGLRAAMADGAGCVGYWDADLATPLAAILDFAAVIASRPTVDVVMGSRVRMLGRRIRRSGTRHYLGRLYATLASLALRLPVYDTQCGAKLFRSTACLEEALAAPFRSRWSFDVELLRRLQRAWGDSGVERIVEIPLDEWCDRGGSKVTLGAGARAFADLVAMMVERGPPRRSA